MKAEYLFPLLLVLIYLGAAIVCSVKGDYARGFYWLLAAAMNVTISIWIGHGPKTPN